MFKSLTSITPGKPTYGTYVIVKQISAYNNYAALK